MAAATKARLYTRRVPGPGSSLCAKPKARLYTRGMPGPGPSLSSSTCPNPFFALALGLCTQANSHQEKWGQAPLRSTLRDSIARAHAVVVLPQISWGYPRAEGPEFLSAAAGFGGAYVQFLPGCR